MCMQRLCLGPLDAHSPTVHHPLVHVRCSSSFILCRSPQLSPSPLRESHCPNSTSTNSTNRNAGGAIIKFGSQNADICFVLVSGLAGRPLGRLIQGSSLRCMRTGIVFWYVNVHLLMTEVHLTYDGSIPALWTLSACRTIASLC